MTIHPRHTPSRFEVKYEAPRQVAVALRADIQAKADPDSHHDDPLRGYQVESLYFEGLSLTSYLDKAEGVPTRLKFRVRRYGHGGEPYYLELKERFNNCIRKARTVLDTAAYEACLAGRFPSTVAESSAARWFWLERGRVGLRPFARVDYERLAFQGRTDRNLRITLDTDLRATRARSLTHTFGSSVPLLAPGHALVEFKFTEALPHWVHGLIQKYELQNVPMSKYALGVERLMARGIIPYV